jgi:hypothetical protein
VPTKRFHSRHVSTITYPVYRALANANCGHPIFRPFTVCLWTVQHVDKFVDVVISVISEAVCWRSDIRKDANRRLGGGVVVCHAASFNLVVRKNPACSLRKNPNLAVNINRSGAARLIRSRSSRRCPPSCLPGGYREIARVAAADFPFAMNQRSKKREIRLDPATHYTGVRIFITSEEIARMRRAPGLDTLCCVAFLSLLRALRVLSIRRSPAGSPHNKSGHEQAKFSVDRCRHRTLLIWGRVSQQAQPEAQTVVGK